MNPILLAAIGGAAAAIVTDLDAYNKARADNKDAVFDWKLAASRCLRGAIYGFLVASGLTQLSGIAQVGG